MTTAAALLFGPAADRRKGDRQVKFLILGLLCVDRFGVVEGQEVFAAAESQEQAGKKQKVLHISHHACLLFLLTSTLSAHTHTWLYVVSGMIQSLKQAECIQVTGLTCAGFVDALHRIAAVRFTKVSDLVSLQWINCIHPGRHWPIANQRNVADALSQLCPCCPAGGGLPAATVWIHNPMHPTKSQ